MDHPAWFLRRHGGILLAPPDTEPFPIDSEQLAYLVESKYGKMPDLSLDEIRSLNKADGLARLVTLAQIAWFCLSCTARGSAGLGFSLEVTTLAYILCTLHTFFFWYYKPLDPGIRQLVSAGARIQDVCHAGGCAVGYLEGISIGNPNTV
jgi:hypothetical protein